MDTISKEELEAVNDAEHEIDEQKLRTNVNTLLRHDDLNSEIAGGVNKKEAIQTVIREHGTKSDGEKLTDLPTVNAPLSYLFAREEIYTQEDLANTEVEEIVSAGGVTGTKAVCIREAARNRLGWGGCVAETVAKKTSASSTEISELYDKLVWPVYTGFTGADPDHAAGFLTSYIQNSNPTSIYAFSFLEVDMVNLLVREGFTTASDIMEATEGEMRGIRYHKIFGDESVEFGAENIKMLKDAASCKLERAERECSSDLVASPTVNDVVELLEEYNIGYSNTSKLGRVATTIVNAVLEMDWSHTVAEQSVEIFSYAKNEDIIEGGSIELTVGACLRIASVLNDEPRPWDAICGMIGEDKREIRNKLSRIVHETELSDDITMSDLLVDSDDCLNYILTNIPETVDDAVAEEIRTRLSNTDTSINNPWSCAGAATYAVLSESSTHSITQNDVSNVVELSNVTLRNNYPDFQSVTNG